MDNQGICTTLTELPNIEEVTPVSEQDMDCLREIKEVLRKHGCLDRFGVSLLHDHFPMSEDEILVEVCDIENRTLTTKPAKRSELAEMNGIETSWRLDTTEALIMCERICRAFGPYHTMRHRSYDF